MTVNDATQLLADFKEFAADEQGSGQYAKWANANPGEYGKWQVFRDGLLAGSRPAAPVLTTPFGQSLVDAGVLYLHATATAPPPPPPPPTSKAALALTTDLSGWTGIWRQRALDLGVKWVREEPRGDIVNWAHSNGVKIVGIYHNDAAGPTPNALALQCDVVEADNEWYWRGVDLSVWAREKLAEAQAVTATGKPYLLSLLAFGNDRALGSGFDGHGNYKGSPAVAQINAAAPQLWGYCAGFAVHTYSPGTPYPMATLDTVRAQLEAIPGAKGKPFWITEAGWATGGDSWGTSEENQGLWTAKLIDDLRARTDVALCSIYRLMDTNGATTSSETYYGLMGVDGRLKPAYAAVKSRVA